MELKNTNSVKTLNYQIDLILRNEDLIFIEKKHFYKERIYHQTYASDWVIIYSDIPPGKLSIRSRDKYIPLAGPTLLYLPPFSLIEFAVQRGYLNWLCVGSSKKIETDIKSPRLISNSSLKIPKNKEDILRLLQTFKDQPEIIAEKSVSIVAERTKKYIDHHFCEDLKIGEVAKKLNYRRELLSREFKKVYGLSPIDYRHQLRVFEALIKVRNGVSFSQAIAEVGFLDPSQFNLQFKKILKARPSQYKALRE